MRALDAGVVREHDGAAGALDAGLEGFGVDARAALERAITRLAGTVVVHAKLGARPPLSEPPQPVPTLASNGRAAAWRTETCK